jgi:hypothetical protein
MRPWRPPGCPGGECDRSVLIAGITGLVASTNSTTDETRRALALHLTSENPEYFPSLLPLAIQRLSNVKGGGRLVPQSHQRKGASLSALLSRWLDQL